MVISGSFAATVWIIFYYPGITANLSASPIGKKWINYIQKIAQIQPFKTEGSEEGVPKNSENKRQSEESSVKVNMTEHYHFTEGLDWIKKHIRGHNDEMNTMFQSLENCISNYLAYMKRKVKIKRPIASYLLLGPTGTGKTYCAQLISKLLYPHADMVHISMGELKNSIDVNILLGAPPGTPGMEVGGQLTKPILQEKYRVILLNEIEKCHTDLHDALYDILDRGKTIERSSRQVVDFTNCVFFATANPTPEVQRLLDATMETDMKGSKWTEKIMNVLTSEMLFKRPFLARFDEIFYFSSLDEVNIAEVVCIKLAEEFQNLNIELQFADPKIIINAIDRIQPTRDLGVREMQRIVNDMIKDERARAINLNLNSVRLGLDKHGKLCLVGVECNQELAE